MSMQFQKNGNIVLTDIYTGFSQLSIEDFSKNYTLLDSITASGAQYIDTGWLIPATPWMTEVVYNYAQPNTSDHSVAGIRQLACKIVNHYNNYYESFVSIPTTYYAANEDVYLRYFTTSNTKNVHIETSTKGTYTGSTSYTPSAATGVNTLPLFGFRETDASTVTWLFYGSIKMYKIYESNVIVHTFIPCKRKSDNVAGMYDGVTGTFHTSLGSSAFVAGNEVENNGILFCNNIIEI